MFRLVTRGPDKEAFVPWGGGRGMTSRRFSAHSASLRVVNMNSSLNVFSSVVGCTLFLSLLFAEAGSPFCCL